MSGGKRTDLGHIVSMLSAVPQGQEAMCGTLVEHSRLFGGVDRVLGDHSRELADLRHGLTDLRSTVANYHASVLGHGILISELEACLARVERHLELPPAA